MWGFIIGSAAVIGVFVVEQPGFAVGPTFAIVLALAAVVAAAGGVAAARVYRTRV